MRFTYPGTYNFIIFDKMSKLRQKLNGFGYFKIMLRADKEINPFFGTDEFVLKI